MSKRVGLPLAARHFDSRYSTLEGSGHIVAQARRLVDNGTSFENCAVCSKDRVTSSRKRLLC
jgi:hypothetical protein